ncbi:hypothetical protein [Mechercharimyces sp. CAU 1602]|uniref:hypothetical protein n=1 Tax=Mechercharimyces sp. CAU 1602 TaxID=2973933 RepID=UPI0021639089|nr:hypothetical protein [Mechercharimyces sp. CAU 1602]MCS1352815.1 hypothetical protein [Mechercharimyces sp. CAU 1602]
MEWWTTSTAANFYGKTRRRMSQLASESADKATWPKKLHSGDFVAPKEIWGYLLSRRDVGLGQLEIYIKLLNIPDVELMGSTEIGPELSVTNNWIAKLAKSYKEVNPDALWPQKLGREWYAPRKIWYEIYQLKKRKRKKKKN